MYFTQKLCKCVSCKGYKINRVRELTKNFITVFGDGKSPGLGSQVFRICAIFYPDVSTIIQRKTCGSNTTGVIWTICVLYTKAGNICKNA
jgi:hypothetical protein